MNEIIEYLKTIPRNNELGINGFLGEELYGVKDKINNFSIFKDKKINILETPGYPKKTKFCLLKNDHKHLLCDEIHIFAIYLIDDDKIVICCSLDSFIDYDDKYYEYYHPFDE